MEKIQLELSENKKEKPLDETSLGFGKLFTDHMFVMQYDTGLGWHDPKIVPYQNISLSPAAKCLHYGQEVFEGLKAYRTQDNKIQLFRPKDNFARLNVSNKRLVIPEIDEEFALEALKQLLQIEKDWVPHSEAASLYIRPFIIGIDSYLGVKPSDQYLFIILLSPSGAYYASGLDPVNIYVENNYVRATPGGMGFAKTAGNYAASFLGQEEAHKQNYEQVLWLDGVHRKYIEEVGAMNIFFKINDEIITPELNGSILPGITRDSVIKLCQSWGYKVSERKISIDEIAQAYHDGSLQEVFGSGTAAVISPVGRLKWNDLVMEINGLQTGEIALKLYDTMTGIQYGKIESPFDWIVQID
ncbi:MAG: branched-chain amino acid aminotransferase [Erysipelotrichaceae bacterium]